MYYGIATETEANIDGMELNLSDDADEMAATYQAALERMQKSGASQEAIENWKEYRAQLMELVDSWEDVEITTKAFGDMSHKPKTLQGAEYHPAAAPWESSIRMNPYTWFDLEGNPVGGGVTPGGDGRMGPTNILGHERFHENGCLDGSSDCYKGADPENATVGSINDANEAVPGMPTRDGYNAQVDDDGNRFLPLSDGPYLLPSWDHLRHGEETPTPKSDGADD